MSLAAAPARWFPIALILISAACGPLERLAPQGRGSDPRQAGAPASGERSEFDFGPKTIAGKEAPATLVAEDGTRCVVTEGRFRRATIGKSAWCAWRTP